MSTPLDKRISPPDQPTDGTDSLLQTLDAMTSAEIAEEMEQILANMTAEDYEPEIIDVYLDALDRKAPMPQLPECDATFAQFQQRMQQISSECAVSKKSHLKYSLLFRKIGRVAVTVAAILGCLFAGMAVAQAAGMDIWGAMARWTENVFSFGPIRSEGAVDRSFAKDSSESVYQNFMVDNAGTALFTSDTISTTSLQEALDTYEIEEIHEPTQIPEGYFLSGVESSELDGKLVSLTATYSNGIESLLICICPYSDESSMHIEKNASPVEIFEYGGREFYLITNNKNYAVAWVSKRFEYCVIGKIEKESLKQFAFSLTGGI